METPSGAPLSNESLDGLAVSQFAPSSVLTDAVHVPAVLPQLLIITVFVSGGLLVKESEDWSTWIQGGGETVSVTCTIASLESPELFLIVNVICPLYVPDCKFAFRFEAVTVMF